MDHLYSGGKVAVLLALWGGVVAAAEEEPYCPVPAVPEREMLSIYAGEMRWHAAQGLALSDGVEVRYGDRSALWSDELRYQNGRTTVPGPFRLQGPGLRLQGTNLEYAEEVAHAQQVRFTSCTAPHPEWSLGAGRLELDRARGWGRAWNTTLRVLDIPVLWLPYLDFPLDERRKSGFLYPRIGGSVDSGWDLSLPYYWDLAPDRDITLTVRSLSRRGVMSALEYRYLHPSGGGRLYAGALPADAEREDDLRGRITAELEHRHGPLAFSLNADRTTDRDYFLDLGDRLEDSSTRYLTQQAALRYRWDRGTAWVHLAEFQSLTTDESPHGRLPELGMQWAGGRSLRYAFSGRWSRFTGTEADGLRLHLRPRLGWDARAPWGFFSPQAGLHYTAYRLDEGPAPGSVTVPVLELDTGLYLERPLLTAGLLQVLEPRLHYRYVPFKNQSGRPLYDTAPLDYSARALFLPDRHTGVDRIGDTSRLSLAVRTGVYDADGVEWGNFTLGRVYFLGHRRVLPGDAAPLEEHASPWLQALELGGTGIYKMSQELHWAPGEGGITRLSALAHYQPDPGLDVQAGWRSRRDAHRLRQGVLEIHWRPHFSWDINGRYEYAFNPGRLLEAEVGLEYQSCCWNARVGARRYLSTGAARSYNTAVYVEFGLQAGIRPEARR